MSARAYQLAGVILAVLLMISSVTAAQPETPQGGAVHDEESLKQKLEGLEAKRAGEDALERAMAALVVAQRAHQILQRAYEESGDPLLLGHAFLYETQIRRDRVVFLGESDERLAVYEWSLGQSSMDEHIAALRAENDVLEQDLLDLQVEYKEATDPGLRAAIEEEAIGLAVALDNNKQTLREAHQGTNWIDAERETVRQQRERIARMVEAEARQLESIQTRWPLTFKMAKSGHGQKELSNLLKQLRDLPDVTATKRTDDQGVRSRVRGFLTGRSSLESVKNHEGGE